LKRKKERKKEREREREKERKREKEKERKKERERKKEKEKRNFFLPIHFQFSSKINRKQNGVGEKNHRLAFHRTMAQWLSQFRTDSTFMGPSPAKVQVHC
jgi:hypothetical protein